MPDHSEPAHAALPEALLVAGDHVRVLDQTALPWQERFVELDSLGGVATAISSMQVRGAPLIGAVAAFGVAFALRREASDDALEAACELLARTRPTAVNLHWAIARMRRVVAPEPDGGRAARAWREALAIRSEDRAASSLIGAHGAAVLRATLNGAPRALRVATHCNAGILANCGSGSALAPVYAAHAAGLPLHVVVSETRPRNQGYLTAWELARAGVAHSVVVDNAAGYLMARGAIDVVLVGADRIAVNGDVVNKIGTYLKALAAHAHGVPFYVVAPSSTIDWNCRQGADVPIEERSGEEVRHIVGRHAGAVTRVAVLEDDVAVSNPAFDVTPHGLITGIITEDGVVAPSELATRRPPS